MNTIKLKFEYPFEFERARALLIGNKNEDFMPTEVTTKDNTFHYVLECLEYAQNQQRILEIELQRLNFHNYSIKIVPFNPSENE